MSDKLEPYKAGDAIQIEVDGNVINGVVTWVEADPSKEYKIKATFTGIPIITDGICTEGSNS